MILDIDPKVDYAFKRVFGREENRDVLVSILEAVLVETEFGTITNLEILNPFNERDTADGKLSVVDVRARQESGEVFNVEMQFLPFMALPQRLLYYWSVSHAAQLDKGNFYAGLKPTIVICFADYVVFPRRSGWHSRFRVVDSEGHVLCPDLEIHILELPKFSADPNAVVTHLDQWLFFLREAKNIDPEHIPPHLTLPAIHKAIQELHMISLNETDHELYESRLKYWRDDQARQTEQRAEGRAEGRVEGRVEGFSKGFVVGRIQLLESLLGLAQSPADRFDSRTIDELLQVEADLKAKLTPRG